MKGVGVALLAIIAIAMALVMATPSKAITCSDLTNMLSPCVTYLKSGGQPTQSCCDGCRKLVGATRSQVDRRTACNCAKGAAARLKIVPNYASQLPGKCGVKTNIPINPNVNCNNIP